MTIGDGLVGVALVALLGLCLWWTLLLVQRLSLRRSKDTVAPNRASGSHSVRPKVGRAHPAKSRAQTQLISISGIDQCRSIACDGESISVSGVRNEVILIGHCADLHVSGIDNVVKGDAAVGRITQSGVRNQVRLERS